MASSPGLDGKKKKLKRSDFDTLADKLNINKKSLENIYKRFYNLIPDFLKFIDISFLHEDIKTKYKELIQVRTKKIFEVEAIELVREIPATVVDVNQDIEPFQRQLSLFD